MKLKIGAKIAIIALVIGITGYGLNKSKLLDNPNVSVAQTSDFTQQTQQQTVTPVQETKLVLSEQRTFH